VSTATWPSTRQPHNPIMWRGVWAQLARSAIALLLFPGAVRDFRTSSSRLPADMISRIATDAIPLGTSHVLQLNAMPVTRTTTLQQRIPPTRLRDSQPIVCFAILPSRVGNPPIFAFTMVSFSPFIRAHTGGNGTAAPSATRTRTIIPVSPA